MKHISVLIAISFALAVPVLSDTKYPKMVYFLSAPHPNFPRGHTHLHGSGRYRIHFDPRTGRATSVEILETTRSNMLDQACIEAFMRWRCEPGTLTQVIIPMSFGK